MATTYLTLPEAAALIGRSERQIRYLIQQGKLAAKKQGRRWLVDKSALDKMPERRRRHAQRLESMEATVRETLSLPAEGENPKWSVLSMRVVTYARSVHTAVVETFSESHPAAVAAASTVRCLVRGGHAFRPADKLAHYATARTAACDTLTEVLLAPLETQALIRQIESDLLPALAGLLRRAEKKQRS
ncbi:MAG: helix-turn-helix domain-containing protein [Myxococcota bacterium]